MRRVVVTGLGMVTPLGCGVETTWKRLIEGESGAKRVESFDVSDLPCQIAGIIPHGDGTDGTYNADQWMEPKEQRKVDDFIVYAMCATRQALDDAGWKPTSHEDQNATGVMIGSGIGGVEGIAETAIILKERGPRRVSPFFIPGRHHQPRLRLRLDRVRAQGPEPCGRHRLLDRRACHRRRRRGSSRSATPTSWWRAARNRRSTAFRSRALRRRARSPPASTTRPSAPRGPTTRTATASSWARAPASWCSRNTSTPRARGAKIYAELIGYGLSGDAYHITAPSPDGDGAFRCMQAAIRRAGSARPRSTTSTRTAPRRRSATRSSSAPCSAWSAMPPAASPMSSTKSSIGHLLGAAGAVEAIFSILAIRDQVAPPTLNLDNPSVETRDRPRAASGAQARDRHRAVEFVRVRRHQRVADVPPRCGRIGAVGRGPGV